MGITEAHGRGRLVVRSSGDPTSSAVVGTVEDALWLKNDNGPVEVSGSALNVDCDLVLKGRLLLGESGSNGVINPGTTFTPGDLDISAEDLVRLDADVVMLDPKTGGNSTTNGKAFRFWPQATARPVDGNYFTLRTAKPKGWDNSSNADASYYNYSNSNAPIMHTYIRFRTDIQRQVFITLKLQTPAGAGSLWASGEMLFWKVDHDLNLGSHVISVTPDIVTDDLVTPNEDGFIGDRNVNVNVTERYPNSFILICKNLSGVGANNNVSKSITRIEFMITITELSPVIEA